MFSLWNPIKMTSYQTHVITYRNTIFPIFFSQSGSTIIKVQFKTTIKRIIVFFCLIHHFLLLFLYFTLPKPFVKILQSNLLHASLSLSTPD